MCDMIVDLESVAHHHGVDPTIFLDDLDRLQSLTRDDLVHIEGWKVIIPPYARLAMRSVASVFDAYLMEGQNRHAAAV
jgi:coproporphyrinogen III oxidase-like Fe-S oxidoreductase